jgi:hypothetical protein
MRSPDDFAGSNPDAEYCSTCADGDGALRPYDDVVQANAEYLVRQQGIAMLAAREMARALLASMPAWRGQP